jgi:hypothetical protein
MYQILGCHQKYRSLLNLFVLNNWEVRLFLIAAYIKPFGKSKPLALATVLIDLLCTNI